MLRAIITTLTDQRRVAHAQFPKPSLRLELTALFRTMGQGTDSISHRLSPGSQKCDSGRASGCSELTQAYRPTCFNNSRPARS